MITLAPEITHLRLGCKFMAAAPGMTTEPGKRGVGAHRSQWVLDLHAVSLNSVTTLMTHSELYYYR